MTEIFNINSESEFHSLMEQVDAQLRSENIVVIARPIKGLRAISSRYGLGLRVLPIANRASESGVYTGDDLVIRVYDWFDCRYGDQLAVDFGPGHTVVLIRGDLYRVRLPRNFGRVAFVADPFAQGQDIYPSLTHMGQMATVNVLDCVKGLQPAMSQALKASELRDIKDRIQLDTLRFTAIEKLYNTSLGGAAKADLRASIDRLMDNPPHNGQSRWASLQAAEKFLKIYIDDKTRSYPKGHNLRKLADMAGIRLALGLTDTLLDRVQCDAGVRYELTSSREEAINAFRVACLICWKVAKALRG